MRIRAKTWFDQQRGGSEFDQTARQKMASILFDLVEERAHIDPRQKSRVEEMLAKLALEGKMGVLDLLPIATFLNTCRA
jgi:hypothetical protein